jgi:4-alpha-glucanotransferase
MKRESGVLLNISSLPGRFGIGGLSREAENFIEEISSIGFHIWQTLPITSIGNGNSPYSSISTYAGNYLYLDPERFDDGLLTNADINNATYHGDIYLTNYQYAKDCKKNLLHIALERITPAIQERINDFVIKNKNWINDYAVFMCLREHYENKHWIEWDKIHRIYSTDMVNNFIRDNFDKVNYYFLEQYLFSSQWNRIKDFAHKFNVKIFGDLPIYVSYNSVDVWSNTKLFQLYKNLKPKKIAGVPPDYFAKEGQLWGNPLYDYKIMEQDNYKWWIDRISYSLNLYDMVRIDHFRGLYKYWAVDADAPNAINGKWQNGPQMKLFNALKKVIPNPNIIAEDLGLIDKDVEEFLNKCGYMGMRVMHFGFDGDVLNKHLPHNFKQNCIAYTGTHDNDTSLGWLLSLDENVRNTVFDYIDCESGHGWAYGAGSCRATKSMIRCIIASCANIAIIPMQDLCGYGSDTRMNIPGVATGCWEYRTNYTAISCIDREYLRKINTIYGRC